MPAAAPKQENTYDAKLDAKGRITIRGADAGTFRVTRRRDGSFLLRPYGEPSGGEKGALPNDAIDASTLRMIDSAVKNLKAGRRSKPADLKRYEKYSA